MQEIMNSTDIAFPYLGIYLKDVPKGFYIGNFFVAYYGVIIGLGILAGIMMAVHNAKRIGLDPDVIWDFSIYAIIFSIIGARAYYVIFEWENYAGEVLSVFRIWEGGLAIYGGVLGGLVTAILFCRYHKFPLFRFLDLIVPSLVLGQAIGRWGNFMNQEAFGNLVANPSLQFFPFAVYIDALGEWHQATFFYESAWNFCLLITMLLLSRRKPHTGTLTCMYFVVYGIGRFLIEGLRADSLYVIPGFRASQLLSLILVCVGLSIYFIFVRTGKFKQIYSGDYAL